MFLGDKIHVEKYRHFLCDYVLGRVGNWGDNCGVHEVNREAELALLDLLDEMHEFSPDWVDSWLWSMWSNRRPTLRERIENGDCDVL